MTAVVTDVHYRMSLAVIRDLAEAGVRVVACRREGTGVPLGFRSRWPARRVTLPAEGYGDALYALCRSVTEAEGERPALLPIGAATLRLLAEERDRFSAVCGLCVPAPAQLAQLNDKEQAAALAGRCGVPVPEEYVLRPGEGETDFFARVPLPCIVKPRCGEALGLTAALRYVRAETAEQLAAAYARFSDLAGEPPLVQEYLPGNGFGCSVLAREGQVLRAVCHRRVREYPITGGPSACCDAVDRPDLTAMAAAMTAACGYTGVAMFEFKEDGAGQARLLEVNPRVWGSYPLTRVCASGFSLAWCTEAWDRGNPDRARPLPPERGVRLCRMSYFPVDRLAARAYARAGQTGRAREPGGRDGLFEWRDPAPALAYWLGLLRRKKERGGGTC